MERLPSFRIWHLPSLCVMSGCRLPSCGRDHCPVVDLFTGEPFSLLSCPFPLVGIFRSSHLPGSINTDFPVSEDPIISPIMFARAFSSRVYHTLQIYSTEIFTHACADARASAHQFSRELRKSSGNIGTFCRFKDSMVRLFGHSLLLMLIFWQRELFYAAECVRQLDLRAELTDRDVNMFQEAIIDSTPFFDFTQEQMEATAILYAIMTPEQRENLLTARWYIDGIENMLFDLAETGINRDAISGKVHNLIRGFVQGEDDAEM